MDAEEKRKIVLRMLKEGRQVSPQELERLSAKKEFVLVDDYIEYYTDRFVKLRRMLMEKISPVSINKLKRSRGELWTIGMVKRVSKGKLVIEDQTGDIEVKSDMPGLEPDIVVGARGFAANTIFFANEIILPDIPLKREVGKGRGTVAFCFGPCELDKGVKCAFILSEGEADGVKTINNRENPTWLRNGIKILLYRPSGSLSIDDAVKRLRFRHLEPSFSGTMKTDNLVIEEAPDIFCFFSNRTETMNYKGVTLIGLSEDGKVYVNLETREIVV